MCSLVEKFLFRFHGWTVARAIAKRGKLHNPMVAFLTDEKQTAEWGEHGTEFHSLTVKSFFQVSNSSASPLASRIR